MLRDAFLKTLRCKVIAWCYGKKIDIHVSIPKNWWEKSTNRKHYPFVCLLNTTRTAEITNRDVTRFFLKIPGMQNNCTICCKRRIHGRRIGRGGCQLHKWKHLYLWWRIRDPLCFFNLPIIEDMMSIWKLVVEQEHVVSCEACRWDDKRLATGIVGSLNLSSR